MYEKSKFCFFFFSFLSAWKEFNCTFKKSKYNSKSLSDRAEHLSGITHWDLLLRMALFISHGNLSASIQLTSLSIFSVYDILDSTWNIKQASNACLMLMLSSLNIYYIFTVEPDLVWWCQINTIYWSSNTNWTLLCMGALETGANVTRFSASRCRNDSKVTSTTRWYQET